MSPREECRAYGIDSLSLLAKIVNKPRSTLLRWRRDNPALWFTILKGANQ